MKKGGDGKRSRKEEEDDDFGGDDEEEVAVAARAKRGRSSSLGVSSRLAKKIATAAFQNKLRDSLQRCWPSDCAQPQWSELASALQVTSAQMPLVLQKACSLSSAMREFVTLLRVSRPSQETAPPVVRPDPIAGPLEWRGEEAMRCVVVASEEQKSVLRRLKKRFASRMEKAEQELKTMGLLCRDLRMSASWTALLTPDERLESESSIFYDLKKMAAKSLAGAAASRQPPAPDAPDVAALEGLVKTSGQEGVALRIWLCSNPSSGLASVLALRRAERVFLVSGQNDVWIVDRAHFQMYAHDGVLLNPKNFVDVSVFEDWKTVFHQHVRRRPMIRLEDLECKMHLGHAVMFDLMASLMETNDVTVMVNSQGSIGIEIVLK